ncbi:phox-domain containing partial [Plasmopara halstedii]|uniref:Phox-domain containing partial n=1 Tax=Plasmopara halstedii TaxID=4781 RepID=A0A0P1A480_PLAHL|nr:phox-domain containing partial [Plasmopara halstedii]CEG35316.1 phox-domain containing partial [Plasmopara halstedii]
MVIQNVLAATPQRVLHTSIAHFTKPAASGAHVFTQYLVRVSDERSPNLNWTVYRRYSEFRNLKLAVEEAVKRGDMCNHCAIMSRRTCFVLFPHRRIFNNMNVKILEARRIGLNVFLDAVAKHARTCRESMTCQTRPLMDKFLMVNDMRYTYLNINISETRGDDERRKNSVSEKHATMTGVPHRSVSVSSTDRLSRYSDYREEGVRSCTEEWTHTNYDGLAQSTDPTVDQSLKESYIQESTQLGFHLCQEESGVVVKRSTVPHILAYTNSRCYSNSSWIDNNSSRLSLTFECVGSAYKPPSNTSTSTSRHSDPGLARNELLNFSRGSFSGGGRQHHAESRPRPRSRKVYLSSAAKRVKKLEEAEARFSLQAQIRKPKCLPRLSTIPE